MLRFYLLPIAGALLVLGTAFFLRVFQRRTLFSGYGEIREDVLRLAKALDAEVFRDHQDLALRGSHKKWPVLVRFSSRATDIVSIQMGTPATFQMSIQARSLPVREGKTRISTRDSRFDARFAATSNNPTEARLFVREPEVMELTKKLCVSLASSLRISHGRLEVAESSFRAPDILGFILGRLPTMETLAGKLGEMPGADTITIVSYKRKGNRVERAVMAVALALALVAAIRWPGGSVKEQAAGFHSSPVAPAGILPADALQIGNLAGWRLAQESDFSHETAYWLRGEGVLPSGRIAVDLSGNNTHRDMAYILIDGSQMMRVVLFSQGLRVYDQRYQSIAIASRMPHSGMASATWKDGVSANADGDGLLLATRGDDRTSGVVFTMHDGKLTFNLPADYRNLNLL